jgi:hypothetical protein
MREQIWRHELGRNVTSEQAVLMEGMHLDGAELLDPGRRVHWPRRRRHGRLRVADLGLAPGHWPSWLAFIPAPGCRHRRGGR